jgi:hypothetical protein
MARVPERYQPSAVDVPTRARRIAGYFYAAHEEVARTVTNVATGESVTQLITVRYTFLKVTDNGDGTSTVVSQRPTRVVYVQDGRVIARGAGFVRFEGLGGQRRYADRSVRRRVPRGCGRQGRRRSG